MCLLYFIRAVASSPVLFLFFFLRYSPSMAEWQVHFSNVEKDRQTSSWVMCKYTRLLVAVFFFLVLLMEHFDRFFFLCPSVRLKMLTVSTSGLFLNYCSHVAAHVFTVASESTVYFLSCEKCGCCAYSLYVCPFPSPPLFLPSFLSFTSLFHLTRSHLRSCVLL